MNLAGSFRLAPEMPVVVTHLVPPLVPPLARPCRRTVLTGGMAAVLASVTLPGVTLPSAAQSRGSSEISPALVQAFDRALEAYRAGDLENGDRAAQAVDDKTAQTALRWAAIRLNGGDNLGLNRILDFLRDEPNWPGRAFTRRKAEAAFLASNPAQSEVLVFFAGQQPATQTGRFRLALALKQSGKAADADAMARALWREEALSAQQRVTLREQFAPALRAADHMQRIEMLLASGDRDAAIKTAELLGAAHVKWVRARIAAANGAKDASKLLAELPDSLKRTPGYRLALAQTLREKPEESALALSARGEDAEGALGDQLANERRIVATRLIEARKIEAAFTLIANHEADSGSRGADADIFAGFIALRLMKDPQRAAPLFDKAMAADVNAATKARAAYWRGRAAEAMRADATPFFRRAADQGVTYYGQLAAVRLGQRTIRLRSGPDGSDRIASPVVRAIRLFEAVEARDLALPLYIDSARQAPDAETIAALTRIARAHGDARGELTVARIALQRGFPFEREAFPILPVADKAFAGQPDDWALAHAIAKQESSFDTKAVSSAGARGLMQVLPGTAKETAKKIGRSYDFAALTADPGYNLLIGTAYFSELSRSFDGSMVLAVAAYNAGPGNVRKWLDAIGDPRQPNVDVVDWVERIPFSETRSYVQRVLENWQIYRQRQGRQASLRSEQDLKRQDRP